MKFVIKHEIKGRLRVHMAQQRMTYEQADVLQYYLQQSDLVVDAKVYEQTADVVISYNGDRAAMIHLLCTFKYQMVEVPEGYLESTGRELNSEYKEKLTSVNNELGKVLGENLQMALPTIALDGHVALTTAYMNDCEPLLCFAQQVNGYGKEGDVFLGISTSGNSKNILYAAVVAKAKGMKVVALTGAKDSKLSQIADVTIKAPETRTYRIQEYHLPIYHCLCLMLEERFFGDNN